MIDDFPSPDFQSPGVYKCEHLVGSIQMDLVFLIMILFMRERERVREAEN